MKSRRIRFEMAMLMALAFVLGGWIFPNLHVSWREAAAHANGRDVASISPDEVYARAAAVAGPSIVNIDTESRVRVRGFFDDDFFSGGPRYRRVSSSGSGVLVSADGEIITNEHVVGNAESIKVTLPDGRAMNGRV